MRNLLSKFILAALFTSQFNLQAFCQIHLAVPYIEEAKTPIEIKLQSPDLALTGLGLGATKSQLSKRLQTAELSKWLAQTQLDKLKQEYQSIVESEKTMRDKEGKLSFESRHIVAKQLYEFNEKFEEQVLLKEQTAPGLEGLQAREALISQRISKAAFDGRITAKTAARLRQELAKLKTTTITSEPPAEQAKEIASNLHKLAVSLSKEIANKQIALKGPYTIRAKDASTF